MKEKIKRTRSEIGKKNKIDGAKFELLVRKKLESEGWIVSKWQNNIEWEQYASDGFDGKDNSNLRIGKIISAKRKYNPFNKVLTIGTGFPDFVCFRKADIKVKLGNVFLDEDEFKCKTEIIVGEALEEPTVHSNTAFLVVGVEAKSNGILDKEEKEKIKWLLENNIFSKFIVAKKGDNKGEIKFIELRKKEK
jgi:hypothetical protein